MPVSAGGGAAEPAVGSSRDYPRSYFDQYSPSTALDMLQRVPGFSLDEGDQDTRGFGGAAGNVVINGARPSAKSDSLSTILSRIPAGRVVRIEIAAGDRFGAEYTGRAQVANLILSEGGGLSGTLEAQIAHYWPDILAPQGSVSALLQRGQSSFSASIGYDNSSFLEAGPDEVRTLPDMQLRERRDKRNRIRDRNLFATAGWALNAGENRSAHLNLRHDHSPFRLDQTNHVTPATGPERDDTLAQRYLSNAWEVGGDVTRPLAGGGWKTVGLYRTRKRDEHDDIFNIVNGNVLGGNVQEAVSRADEAVVRTSWSRQNSGGWSLETGAEGAFNRLNSDVQLFSVAPGGALTRIDLPIDSAIVTEYRGELFVTAGRNVAGNLRLDGGLTYERSRLTVTGDATAKRNLQFLKPRVSADWHPGGGWRVQGSITRTIAQLDFGDFIGAAELTSDRVDGGNAELLPQRAWEFQISAEHALLGDGRVQIEVDYYAISLLQDRVPTQDGGDAPGNLGNGRTLYISGTLDIPLATLGIRGGRLTASGWIRDTSVRDPYTGLHRPYSNRSKWYSEVSFRQDLGKFAWGVSYEANPSSTTYRRDETDTSFSDGTYVEAFAEYRPAARTVVTLTAKNLLQLSGGRHRLFYAPDRSNPMPVAREDRLRSQHIGVFLALRQSFG